MPVQWSDFTLEPGAVPVYEQLASWLEGLIRAGTLAPGERLPSERDWAPRTGHSYDSARRATALLKARGLLESRQGVGTAVTVPSKWAK